MSDAAQEPPSLYVAREPIFPRRVSGKFRNLKWYVMAVTLGIYYLVPWIRWDRGPNLPDQAVLSDIAGRRFYFFWIEIWPHEFYFVGGLLIMAGLGLFLFTSALGRVWCGYACPQTVWTDLFILVERWIEGDRNARLRLHRQKMNFRKLYLRLMKWSIWLMIGLLTGGAWVFYFADAPTLARDLISLNAHPIAYTTIAILTSTTFFFGGFAREQICIYACPWPRIQAVMMDEDSITVGYRGWRGEPRKGSEDVENGADMGDCINCMACVNVCPMGIDIRDGQQMECITCALCIDACDDVMEKIGKPRGLVDYMALSDEPLERAGQKPRNIWMHIFRPRTILYSVLWSSVGIMLVFALFVRSPIDLSVAPIRNPVFVTLSDGSIRNTYDIRIRNQSNDESTFEIHLNAPPDLLLKLEGHPDDRLQIDAQSMKLQRVYVVTPGESEPARAEHTDVRFWVENLADGARAYTNSTFFGKGN